MVNMEKSANKNANVRMMDNATLKQENVIVNLVGLVKFVRTDALRDFMGRNASKHVSASMGLNAITKRDYVNVKLVT